MIIRLAALLLTVLVAGLFGQFERFGTFGRITVRLKAGDLAPDVSYSKVLHTEGPDPWVPANFQGRLTAVFCFPYVSGNPQLVSQWNELVERFSGKPVQFVWVAGEQESTLIPFLQEHPIKGWLFNDPDGNTGRSYGLDFPQPVIIGADGRIVGFDEGMVPRDEALTATLEDRVTTTAPERTLAGIRALMESGKVLLSAEPRVMPSMQDHRPNFPPSYTLHVSSSNTEDRGDFSAPDYWALNGFELKEVISRLYDLNPIRIQLPVSLDDGRRYDFGMVLPQPEDRERKTDLFRRGVEDHFRITGTRVQRMQEVYVVTSLDRKPPASAVLPEFAQVSSSGVEYQTSRDSESKAVGLHAIRSIGLEGTADEFCRTLERVLDRPVINETRLQGTFEFNVQTSRSEKNDFLERLRDELGLVITPAQRTTEILVFEPRN